MKKLLVLLMLLQLNIYMIKVSNAEEIDATATDIQQNEQPVLDEVSDVDKNKAETPDDKQSEENNPNNHDPILEQSEAVAPEDISSEPNGTVEFEKTAQVEKNIVSLPACDDEKLVEQAHAFIKTYYDTVPNKGTIYRRRRYFILHNLNKFSQENIDDYRTAATSPISDIIVDTKVNQGVIEENLRLCKNKSLDMYAGKVYMLLYPTDEGIKVRLMNLSAKQTIGKETSFIYQN